MWPAPIRISASELPPLALFRIELSNGERLYTFDNVVYAVQP